MDTPEVTFEKVMSMAQKLSPLEKLRLIERLAPDLEAALQASAHVRRRSLRGILRGDAISEEDIDQIRREMWDNFPREDV
jgi:hypothetical protein